MYGLASILSSISYIGNEAADIEPYDSRGVPTVRLSIQYVCPCQIRDHKHANPESRRPGLLDTVEVPRIGVGGESSQIDSQENRAKLKSHKTALVESEAAFQVSGFRRDDGWIRGA